MYKISKMVWASKIVWASKVALATILLGFLFVGGASLQAQEGSENGWFVSASPLIFGASKIETKTTITGGGGEVTVGDLTADIRTDFFDADTTNLAQNSARDLCAGTLVGVTVASVVNGVSREAVVLDNLEILYLAEDRSDATDATLSVGSVYSAILFQFNGEAIPFTENIITPNTNLSLIPDSACKDAFDELLLQDLSANATGSSETSVGKALAGNGFQVGYRGGNYRYSLTNYSWAADSDKLDLQIAMIEYYLAKGLLLGLGTANVKLDSSIGSQSQRATAFSVSYQYPIFKNFFVEANYTLLQTNLSLQKETIIAEEAISQTDRQEIGFLGKNFALGAAQIVCFCFQAGVDPGDRRVTVTRSQSRSAVQTIETKTVEVKNPSALTIKFTYKFW